MTGVLGGDGKRITLPPSKTDPPPAHLEAEEMDEAKKKVRKRAKTARGREGTILAGRMMAERKSTNELKQILGA